MSGAVIAEDIDLSLCFSRSSTETTLIEKPFPVIVVDFSNPVTMTTFNFVKFAQDGETTDLSNYEEKTDSLDFLEESSTDSLYKYEMTEEATERFRYALIVSGERESSDGEGIIIQEKCEILEVDFGELELSLESPQEKYVSDPNTLIEFSTTRRAECRISTETSVYEDMDSMSTTNDYNHTNQHPKKSAFSVTCLDEFEDKVSEQYNIVLDTTPPTAPGIDDTSFSKDHPQISLSTQALRVKFSANDSESGIEMFNFTIVEKETQREIMPWMTTDEIGEFITISEYINGSPLNLSDETSYLFRAKAMNKAGLWSPVSESDGVQIDTSFTLITDPEQLCKNGKLDDGEVYIDCGGACQGCVNGHECEKDTHCDSGFCNNDTGICAQPSCSDDFLNGDETDIDCGGDCVEKCLNNLTCDVDADCVSNFCFEGNCREALCNDSIQNGNETDVDCGGSCSECEIGKNCNEDTDCLNEFCSNGFCEEKIEENTGGLEDTGLSNSDNLEEDSDSFPTQIIFFILGGIALGLIGYYVLMN